MYSWKKCKEQTRGQNFLQRLFSCGPSLLDTYWRRSDFRLHRSYDGLIQKWLKIDGHSPLAFGLAAATILFMIYGPSPGWRGFAPILIFLISCGLLYAGARWFKPGWLMVVELVLLAILSIFIWFWASPEAVEADSKVYRHLLMVAVPVIFIPLLLLSKGLAWLLLRRMRSKSILNTFLPHVNLFAPTPTPPKFSFVRIVRSLVNVPLRYPLHLLFFISLVALFVPYYFSVTRSAIYATIVFWLLISFASIHDRFNAILPLISRALFTGGQLTVSLVLIILAAGRLFEISYVQTVVESSAWDTMLSYIAAAYTTFWFFEYWINRILCEQLIGLIKLPQDPAGKATYRLDPNDPYPQSTAIHPDHRSIQIHGGARFIVIGKLNAGKSEAYQPYEKKALFQKLIERAAENKKTKTSALKDEVKRIPIRISRCIRFYFSLINSLLIVLAIVTGILLSNLPQQPIAKAVHKDEHKGVDLGDLIWQNPERKKVILLAASGGGTRAALYTQSVLHGLHGMDALKDLVLVSGVSGGGAALAYYAAHKEILMDDQTGRAWERFTCDMSHPFIWDVLEGATEWRVIAGTRLGQLLADSFKRIFYREDKDSQKQAARKIGVKGLGVILNTALAGHLDCPQCKERKDFAKAAAEEMIKKSTDGSVAGGRLIFTNLDDVSGFSGANTSLNIPYAVVQDPDIPLVTAAALNANFPPVFSNAPVDVDNMHRYWVTDGGATENRGLMSLLMALRTALRDAPDAMKSIPEIHIVMADASAGSTKYSQNRGIGTKFGAPAKLANQLIRELLDEVTCLYAYQKGKIYYHELAMPDFLRIDGGLGTHWMLPRAVKMKIRPDDTTVRQHETLELDTFTVRQLINDLHRVEPADKEQAHKIQLCENESLSWLWSDQERKDALDKIHDYMQLHEQPHRKAWQRLSKAWTKGLSDDEIQKARRRCVLP